MDGRDFYLGRYDSPESRAEDDWLIAQWLSNGRVLGSLRSSGGSDCTINKLLLAYLRHADGHYVKAGSPTREVANIRLAIRPLRQRYGHAGAHTFGPLKLKAVRQSMIDAGICRSEINRRVGRSVRVFKSGVGEGMVRPGDPPSLQAIPGFRRGRADVREAKPVPESSVEAIRPHVARQVWAMVELQSLSGMRPGEVVSMGRRSGGRGRRGGGHLQESRPTATGWRHQGMKERPRSPEEIPRGSGASATLQGRFDRE